MAATRVGVYCSQPYQSLIRARVFFSGVTPAPTYAGSLLALICWILRCLTFGDDVPSSISAFWHVSISSGTHRMTNLSLKALQATLIWRFSLDFSYSRSHWMVVRVRGKAVFLIVFFYVYLVCSLQSVEARRLRGQCNHCGRIKQYFH